MNLQKNQSIERLIKRAEKCTQDLARLNQINYGGAHLRRELLESSYDIAASYATSHKNRLSVDFFEDFQRAYENKIIDPFPNQMRARGAEHVKFITVGAPKAIPLFAIVTMHNAWIGGRHTFMTLQGAAYVAQRTRECDSTFANLEAQVRFLNSASCFANFLQLPVDIGILDEFLEPEEQAVPEPAHEHASAPAAAELENPFADEAAPARRVYTYGEESFDLPLPKTYACALSGLRIRNPLVSPYGQAYERKAIQAHLAREETCPVTRRPLRADELHFNARLAQLVDRWAYEHDITAGADATRTAA